MSKKKNNCVNRIKQKTYLYALVSSLRSNYNMSLKEADLLSNDFIKAYTLDNPSNLIDGQLFYSAIHKDEPAGKPVAACQKKRIKLTLFCHEFILQSPTDKTRDLIYSMPWQALSQDTLLTDEDLAFILNISLRTVFRIYKEYKLRNLYIPTRGNFHSFGAGQSHKAEALKLFFQNKPISKIAFILNHAISSVERYIDDFARTFIGYYDEKYPIDKLSSITKIAKHIILQYIEIFNQYKDHSDMLNFLRKRYYLLKKKKIFRRHFYAKIKTKRNSV